MEYDIGLTEQQRQGISNGLSRFLADTYALYLKTQDFHWNITGAEFYSLHLLLEKHYEDMAAAIDEIAERIRALGFYVDASFTSLNQQASIKGENRVLAARDMLAGLIQGHQTLIVHVRNVAALADKEGDFATVDLIGRRLGAHEKMAWMLQSQLKF
jgi:starvation-inducible DNA-binding protein